AEVEQLDRGAVVGEVAAVFDDLAELEVDGLDGVGGVDHFADGGVEFQERDELVPGALPGGDHPGGLLCEFAAQVVEGGFGGGLVDGGVDGPHEGGGAFAVLPGHVFHRGADEVDDAGLHDCLLPGGLHRV